MLERGISIPPAPGEKRTVLCPAFRIHHYVGEAHVLGVPLLILIPAALMLGAALSGGLGVAPVRRVWQISDHSGEAEPASCRGTAFPVCRHWL